MTVVSWLTYSLSLSCLLLAHVNASLPYLHFTPSHPTIMRRENFTSLKRKPFLSLTRHRSYGYGQIPCLSSSRITDIFQMPLPNYLDQKYSCTLRQY